MFIYAGLAIVYLAFGYALGVIAGKELFNQKSTKDLSLLGKLKRCLFYPMRYSDWDFRHKICIDNPLSIHELAGYEPTDGNDGYKIYRDEQKEKKYYRIMAFLWPFELIPMTLGIVYLVIRILLYVAVHPIGGSISWVFDKVEKLFVRLPEVNRIFSSNQFSLEQFQNNEMSSYHTKLLKTQDTWRGRLNELREFSSDITRQTTIDKDQALEQLHQMVRQAIADIEKKLNGIEKAEKEFSKNQKVIESAIKRHKLFAKGKELLQGGQSQQAQIMHDEAMSSAYSAMAAMRKIMKQAGQAEIDSMNQMDMPVEVLANRKLEVSDQDDVLLSQQLESRLRNTTITPPTTKTLLKN